MSRRSRSRGRHGRRRGEHSDLPWILAFGLLVVVAGAAGWFVIDKLTGRTGVDEATLCPVPSGPTSVVAVLLDLTDPLGSTQAARLKTLLEREVDEAPTNAMISLGVVSSDPEAWGSQFHVCKPATGEDASILYENPRLIADQFRARFQDPFEAQIDTMMRGDVQESSPIMEALQALLAETPEALDSGKPLRVVLVSDLLQHSDLLSFYRGEGWDAFEASGRADELSRNLQGAEFELIRIPRPDAPATATAQVDGFWSRYLDRQGAAAPVHELTLGAI